MPKLHLGCCVVVGPLLLDGLSPRMIVDDGWLVCWILHTMQKAYAGKILFNANIFLVVFDKFLIVVLPLVAKCQLMNAIIYGLS